MYDFLLTLHLLGAATAFITIAFFSVWALGLAAPRAQFLLADATWNVSGGLLLVFGIWLALYVDGYELWDGWILGAVALFAAASWFGARAHANARDSGGADGLSPRQVTAWHWLRTLSVLAILVLMVWKPGA